MFYWKHLLEVGNIYICYAIKKFIENILDILWLRHLYINKPTRLIIIYYSVSDYRKFITICANCCSYNKKQLQENRGIRLSSSFRFLKYHQSEWCGRKKLLWWKIRTMFSCCTGSGNRSFIHILLILLQNTYVIDKLFRFMCQFEQQLIFPAPSILCQHGWQRATSKRFQQSLKLQFWLLGMKSSS